MYPGIALRRSSIMTRLSGKSGEGCTHQITRGANRTQRKGRKDAHSRAGCLDRRKWRCYTTHIAQGLRSATHSPPTNSHTWISQTGATLQLFKGHTAPVTALEFYKNDGKTYLISGSWDKVCHNRSWVWIGTNNGPLRLSKFGISR